MCLFQTSLELVGALAKNAIIIMYLQAIAALDISNNAMLKFLKRLEPSAFDRARVSVKLQGLGSRAK